MMDTSNILLPPHLYSEAKIQVIVCKISTVTIIIIISERPYWDPIYTGSADAIWLKWQACLLESTSTVMQDLIDIKSDSVGGF